MKFKDLGYALIGVIASAKKDKFDEELSKLDIELKTKLHEELLVLISKTKEEHESKQRNFKVRGEALRQVSDNKRVSAERCNHRKGGNGVIAIVQGRGDTNQYAVIKHRHRNGDTHIHCLRCPKVWMPGDSEYYKALNFDTRNVTSTDVVVATTMTDGKVTGDFAEAFRKWTNAIPHKGISFYPSQIKEEEKESKKLVDKLKEISKQEITRPVTFRKEYVPTVIKTEVPATENVTFKMYDAGPSLVS